MHAVACALASSALQRLRYHVRSGKLCLIILDKSVLYFNVVSFLLIAHFLSLSSFIWPYTWATDHYTDCCGDAAMQKAEPCQHVSALLGMGLFNKLPA